MHGVGSGLRCFRLARADAVQRTVFKAADAATNDLAAGLWHPLTLKLSQRMFARCLHARLNRTGDIGSQRALGRTACIERDTLIAAVALVHGMTAVTRNVAYF